MRRLPIFAFVLYCAPVLLVGSGAALSQSAPAKVAPVAAAKPAPLLPDAFAGWVADEASKSLKDAAQADAVNAAALQEYELSEAAVGSYKRDGETLILRALRFHDASGAYGAYSFYRQSGWPKEEIGTGATSNHNRVIFWLGNTVIDANFSRVGPMSAAELRELAGQIPVPDGSRALAPPILSNLPQASLQGQSAHYAVGPTGYAGAGGVLPPGLIGFERGAEAITANYKLRSGPATLTIIDCQTPQMAAAQETLIRDYIKAGSKAQPPWPKPLQDSDLASLEVRRSGPLVALVSGDAVPNESHRLLESVHFAAELTSIPQSQPSEIAKTSKLLVGIAALVVVGCSAAVLLGLFLGGGRALYRVARGRPASSMHEAEFTSLHLRD